MSLIRIGKLLLLFVVLGTIGSSVSCRDTETSRKAIRSVTGDAMGTQWTLFYRGKLPKRLEGEISEILENWEQVLSCSREDSDLMKMNRGVEASEELQRVLDLALEVERTTAGAFDPNLLHHAVEEGLVQAGMKGLDLSGIARGYVVDRVIEHLEDRKVDDFCFELGNEKAARGDVWFEVLDVPDPNIIEEQKSVEIQGRAMSTSGNYRNSKEDPGGFAGYVIDPKTGTSIVRPASSVTVIADSCATADAWATALFVLGREVPAPEGMEVIWLPRSVGTESQ